MGDPLPPILPPFVEQEPDPGPKRAFDDPDDDAIIGLSLLE